MARGSRSRGIGGIGGSGIFGLFGTTIHCDSKDTSQYNETVQSYFDCLNNLLFSIRVYAKFV